MTKKSSLAKTTDKSSLAKTTDKSSLAKTTDKSSLAKTTFEVGLPLLTVGLLSGLMVGMGEASLVAEAPSLGRTMSTLGGSVAEKLQKLSPLRVLGEEETGIEFTKLRLRKKNPTPEYVRHFRQAMALQNPDPTSLFRQAGELIQKEILTKVADFERYPLARYGIHSEYELFNTPMESVRYQLREGEQTVHSYIHSEFWGQTIQQVLEERPKLRKYYELGNHLSEFAFAFGHRREGVPLFIDHQDREGFDIQMYELGSPSFPVTHLVGKYPVHWDYLDLRDRYYRSGLDLFSEEVQLQLKEELGSVYQHLGIDPPVF